MLGEFNLIEKYFSGRQKQRKDVDLAPGDDCAIVCVPGDMRIAVSTDTLVAGTHFLADADPAWVAHKALASNLSDLAAMGATPAWVSLALTLPEQDETWIKPFCTSFFELANDFDIQLIGGDTTKGPLSITLTVQGLLPKDKALCRDGARSGELIFVTGELGDSIAGLEVILGHEASSKPFSQQLKKRHYLATPRILAGQALLDIASSCIDISDGLISDLQHILKCSNVGATLNVNALPFSDELLAFCCDEEQAQKLALMSGEEYELCFTVPTQNKDRLERVLADIGVKVTCIGQTHSESGLNLSKNGKKVDWQLYGYDHFKENK